MYSHLTYDIVDGEEIVLRAPDIVIVEGVNVLQTPARRGQRRADASSSPTSSTSRSTSTPTSTDIEKWYVDRLSCCARRRCTTRESFFNFLTQYTEEDTRAFGRNDLAGDEPRQPAREHRTDRGSRAPRAREGRATTACTACDSESSVSGSSAPHAAQAEPRELGDPARELLGVDVDAVRDPRTCAGRRTRPCPRARWRAPAAARPMPGSRSAPRWRPPRPARPSSTTRANSGSVRIDAPNSSRNAGAVVGDELEVGGEAGSRRARGPTLGVPGRGRERARAAAARCLRAARRTAPACSGSAGRAPAW